PVRGPLSLALNPDAGGEQQASFAESGAGEVALDGLASRILEAARAAGARSGEVQVGEIAALLPTGDELESFALSPTDGGTLLPEGGKSPLDMEAPLHDARADRAAVPGTGALQSEGRVSRGEVDLAGGRLIPDDPAQNAAGSGGGLSPDRAGRAASGEAASGSAPLHGGPGGLSEEVGLSQEQSAAHVRSPEGAPGLAERAAPVDPPEAAPAQLVRRFQGVAQRSLEEMIRRGDGEV